MATAAWCSEETKTSDALTQALRFQRVIGQGPHNHIPSLIPLRLLLLLVLSLLLLHFFNFSTLSVEEEEEHMSLWFLFYKPIGLILATTTV